MMGRSGAVIGRCGGFFVAIPGILVVTTPRKRFLLSNWQAGGNNRQILCVLSEQNCTKNQCARTLERSRAFSGRFAE
jgi:hypothetical protein